MDHDSVFVAHDGVDLIAQKGAPQREFRFELSRNWIRPPAADSKGQLSFVLVGLGSRFVGVNGSASVISAANEPDHRGLAAMCRRSELGRLGRYRAVVGCGQVAFWHARTMIEFASENVPETAAKLSKDTGSGLISISIMIWLSRLGSESQAIWESS